MDCSEDKQNNKQTNDAKNDTGIAIQVHSTFPCKHVGNDEEGDTKRRMYHHHDGGKEKTYSEGC